MENKKPSHHQAITQKYQQSQYFNRETDTYFLLTYDLLFDSLAGIGTNSPIHHKSRV